MSAPDLMTVKEAGHYLRLAPGTLYVLRCRRSIPIPFIRRGRNVLYRREDLDAYLAAATVRP